VSVSITYNGQALTNQISRVSFQVDKAQAVFSCEFAPDAGNVETAIVALKKWDKEFVISSIGWSQTFKLNSTASAIAYVTCRTAVEKASSVLDSRGRKRLRFTAIMELQSVDDAGFRDWAADCDTDAQGRKVITVQGVVTGSGATTAKANFESGIAAIEGAFITLYGGTYEKPVTKAIGLDRYTGRHAFSRTHVQLLEINNVRSGGSETRDVDIIFPTFSIRRTTQLERGSNHPHVKLYAVRWSATLSVGKTGAIALHDSTIRAFLLARINSQFGNDRSLTLVQDDIDYSSSEQSVSSTWVVRAAGGDTIRYRERLKVPMKLADYDKVMDGMDATIEAYSAGMTIEVIQEVEHVTQNSVPPIPPAPMIGGMFAGAKLVLLEAVPDWGKSIAGISTGDGSDTAGEIEDRSLAWTARYAVRKAPESSPVVRQPAGAKGKTQVEF
jgi:hypothetical protein